MSGDGFYIIGELWKFELQRDGARYFLTGKILAVSNSEVKILDKFGEERILNRDEIRQSWKVKEA